MAEFIEFLQEPLPRSIVWLVATGILILVGYYVVHVVRKGMQQRSEGAVELLTNFRELHSQGELTDDEFRTIKTKLGLRLRGEVKNSEKEG
jgi:uncharacterized membrane protein